MIVEIEEYRGAFVPQLERLEPQEIQDNFFNPWNSGTQKTVYMRIVVHTRISHIRKIRVKN